MTDPNRHARDLAADSDPTAWFDRLYAEAEAGDSVVPWDRGAPHPLLTRSCPNWPWTRAAGAPSRWAAVLVRTLNYSRGWRTPRRRSTSLPPRSAAARERFPTSTVDYRVANLLDPPAGWHRAFDLVVESMTVGGICDGVVVGRWIGVQDDHASPGGGAGGLVPSGW